MSATSNLPGEILHHHVVLAIGALRAVTGTIRPDDGLLCVMDVVADSLQLAANKFEEASNEASAEADPA